MQAPSTPASLLLAARRISGSAPPNGLAHARPDPKPAPGQLWSAQDNARQLLGAAREPYNAGATNGSAPLSHTRPVTTSGSDFQPARATYAHPRLSPLNAISGTTTRRAESMLDAVAGFTQPSVFHNAYGDTLATPEAATPALGPNPVPAPHARADAMLHAVTERGAGATLYNQDFPGQQAMPPSLVFDFSRAAAERRQRLANAALHNPARTAPGQPTCPGASTPSASVPCAHFETPDSLQAGDTTLSVTPVSPPEPIITLVNGKLYKPAAAQSRFSRMSAAVASALKRRVIAAPSEYMLAREPQPSMPAGINRRRRPGLSQPDEEPDLDPPGTSAARKAQQVAAEVERTLSLFTSEMAQHMLPYSDDEISQAAQTEEALTAALRDILFKKCERHLASMASARRALLALFDFAKSTGITLHNFKASVGLISAFLSSQTATTMPASRLCGLAWAQKN